MKKIITPLIGLALSLSAFAETQQSWSMLEGPDGKSWYVSILEDLKNVGNEYYDDFVYNSIQVSLYDASHQQMGECTIDLSDLGANAVGVFGPVTNHLFNNDEVYELGVQIHVPGNRQNNYTPYMLFRAYSMEGVKTMEAEGNALIGVCGDFSTLIVQKEVQDRTVFGSCKIEVYQPSDEGLQKKKTFMTSNENLNYMDGTVFMTQNLEDGLHYLFAHYEKPTVMTDSNGEPMYDPITWMPMWTPDNHFVIENYDQNLDKVDEIKASNALKEGLVSRMMGIGIFSDKSITKGYFSGDDRYNYAITSVDMDTNWMEKYAIEVFAQGNEFLGTLSKNNVGFWKRLSEIKGVNDQWAFIENSSEMGDQQILLVETPSMETSLVIPALVDGKLVSSNIDRYEDADGYKYVIGLNEPDSDIDNNVIAQYGIYNKDLTVDKYVNFNMGPDAETFNPLVDFQSLDSHLFYEDDLHEFIFLAKVKGEDNHLYNTLFIGNENGEVLNTYSGYGTLKGDIYSVSILNYDTDQPELFISYYDQSTSVYTNEFISLPIDGSVDVKQVTTTSAIECFNLQGQRIGASNQGLSIKGGKIIFVK